MESTTESTKCTNSVFKTLVTACAVLALSACGGSGGDGGDDPLAANDGDANSLIDVSDSTQCNAPTQKQWAYEAMQDYYVYYDQVPVIDPQVFESTDDVVRSVRFEERDKFSNASDATESALQIAQGREFGLGYRWGYDNDGVPRLARIFTDSPFGRAGLERGDIILSVDGFGWTDNELSDGFGDRVAGTPDNPSTASWSFEKRDSGQVITIDVTAAEYQINTVVERTVFTNAALNQRVGYLAFDRFLRPSEAELDSAFAFFQEQDLTEFILDLRYNGGGLVDVAARLATLIAGSAREGQMIYQYLYNDKYANNNYSLEFKGGFEDLGLSRVVILTTDRTASSSEIVISGLQPYTEVVTIGTRTLGKSQISSPNDRCGERLNILEAEGFNSAGISVRDGIPATCFAEDDLTRNFGISDEGVFEGFVGTAIDYIDNAVCNTEPVTIAARSSADQAARLVPESSRQDGNEIEGAFTR